MTNEPKSQAQTGLPRWLIYGFVTKLVLVVGVVGFLLWWTAR